MLAEGLRPCWRAASDDRRAHDPAVARALDDVAVRDEAVEQERAAAGPCSGPGPGRCRPGCGRPRRRRPRARARRRRRACTARRRWPSWTSCSCAGCRGRPRCRCGGRSRGRTRAPPTRTRAARARRRGAVRPSGPWCGGCSARSTRRSGGRRTRASGTTAQPTSPTTRSRGGSPMSAVSESSARARVDPQADPGGGREAELAGELADLVGVVAGDLVERVLDEVRRRAADERARLRVQRGPPRRSG